MGAKQNKHSHSAVESKHCTVNGLKGVLKIFVSSREMLACYRLSTFVVMDSPERSLSKIHPR